ncbi:hypothetical protein AJ79_07877 [Helicocarpus griseus UAMH5409]|uniref:Cytochrome P450 n=1 Tax=Helicocarpus griseus UAMH5409 TaxID=1447875 RepID=A0A2B7WYE8_9EURO|nr:hypothetical protein AJ79_07877 [Helicocarpus griseus UAMH5409]
MLSLTLTALVGLLIFRLVKEFLYNKSLPPGPPRLPLLGNLHQAPVDTPWVTFREWALKYGPIMSVQFGKDTLIILSDPKIARELLEKRGGIYSTRPRLVMAGENLTKGMHMLLRPYNDRYKQHQRLSAPVLSPRASNTYFPLQDLEAKQLMFDFLHSNDYKKIYERYAASLMYGLTYGFRLDTGDEEVMKTAHTVMTNFGYAGRVGTWLVDAIPVLNYLPLAIAPWKRTAEEFFVIERDMHNANMATALASLHWNWTKELVLSPETEGLPEIEVSYNLGIISDAGLETTAVQMAMFTLACLSYPSFISKAQVELDAVVGPDRLPDFSDRPNLPYIDAVVEESMRWRSIQPGGVPHATSQEDTYNGYRIPKGATVIPLIWKMALDDNAFEKPLEFIPDRWLGMKIGEGSDSHLSNFFGYGRRICTGRHIARNSLYILVARLLWGFNIKHAVDAQGKKKEVDDMALNSGFVCSPKSFDAVFEARSDRHREIIEREWMGAEKDIGVVLDGIKEAQKGVGLTLRA